MVRVMRYFRRQAILGGMLAATLTWGGATAQSVIDPSRAAKEYFGAHSLPTASAAQSFGSYAKGCLAGGMQLPETGPSWQAMRLSRNRNWGHPELIAFVQRLGGYAQAVGWPGIYAGDLSQPRGGPMLGGHRSHQIGLDADIWLRRPGEEVLSRDARERIGSHVVVSSDGINLNSHWTPSHHQLLKLAAQDPAVARIFVNGAIKRALCLAEPPGDRDWLRKIRPWRGHDAHFHVRLSCPADSVGCVNQGGPAPGDGCGAELIAWFDHLDTTEASLGLTRSLTRGGSIRVADLPPACTSVLSGDANALAAVGAAPGTFGEGAAAVSYVEDPAEMIHLPIGVVEANRGMFGSKYFWTAPVTLDAPLVPHVRLALAGDPPPGLFFVDRGSGFGVLKGVPDQAGIYGVEIEVLYGGEVAASMPVSVEIGDRGPTPESIARLDDPTWRAQVFLNEFDGGECLFAEAVESDGSSATVLAFATLPDPIYALDSAFRSAMGFEPDIIGQIVSEGQCKAMRLFESVPRFGGEEPTLSLDRTLLNIGDTLSGSISDVGERDVTLLLIDDSGEVRDIQGYMEAQASGVHRFGVPVNKRGPHVVLAIATPSAIEAPDSSEPEEAQRFFDSFMLRVMRYNFGYQMSYRYINVN